jgi:hypothetical protein
MPYKIVRSGNGYYVVDENGHRKNAKPYPSRAAAMPYFRKLWSLVKKEKK